MIQLTFEPDRTSSPAPIWVYRYAGMAFTASCPPLT
jgi:hypothetical protein